MQVLGGEPTRGRAATRGWFETPEERPGSLAELWRRLGWFGLAGAVAVLVVAPLLPLGDAAGLVVLVLLARVLTSALLLLQTSKGLPVSPVVAVADASLIGTTCFLAPDLLWLFALLLGVHLAYVAVAYGERVVAVTAVASMVPLVVCALLHRPDQWVAVVVVTGLMAVGAVLLTGRMAEMEARERRSFHELLDHLDLVVWEADGDADDPSMLVGPVKRFGHPFSHHLTRGSWESRVHPQDRHVIEESRRAIDEGRDHRVRYRMVGADGKEVWVDETVVLRRAEDGRLLGRRGIVRNVTDEAREDLGRRQLTQFVEAVPFGVALVRLEEPDDDRSLVVTAANPAMATFTSQPPESLVGRRIVDAYPQVEGAVGGRNYLRELADVARSGIPRRLDGMTLHPSGRRPVVIDVTASPLPGRGVALVVEDVSERTLAAHELARRASVDSLTGLANRATLLERVARALDAPERHGEPVTLLLLDLNQFKEANDAFGHQRGDELLIAVAQRLRAAAHEAAAVGRLGGDEFAVLLETGAAVGAGVDMARRITAALSEPVSLDPWLQLAVHASIGVATSPEHAQDADGLVAAADAAMYTSKRAGTGHAVFSHAHSRGPARQQVLLGDLHRSVDADELEIHYQPVVELATDRVVGAEALVRWHHPELGLLRPGEFLDMVELSSLSRPLALAVMSGATAQALAWRRAGWPVRVRVNVPARTLADRGFAAELAEVLAASGLPAGAVGIEVGARQLMGDPDDAAAGAMVLHDAGAALCLVDDASRGDTSWALQRLPVAELLLDRRVAAGFHLDGGRVAGAMVRFGHALGVTVVAEGVEDAPTVAGLRAAGCDRAQGYVFGPPVLPQAVTAGLAAPVRESRLGR